MHRLQRSSPSKNSNLLFLRSFHLQTFQIFRLFESKACLCTCSPDIQGLGCLSVAIAAGIINLLAHNVSARYTLVVRAVLASQLHRGLEFPVFFLFGSHEDMYWKGWPWALFEIDVPFCQQWSSLVYTGHGNSVCTPAALSTQLPMVLPAQPCPVHPAGVATYLISLERVQLLAHDFRKKHKASGTA